MEVDFIHAAIETATKQIPVYIPRDWHAICYLARWKNRYNVIQLDFTSFYDFKEHSKQTMPNLSQINWLKVKWMCYEQFIEPSSGSKSVIISYKYSCEEGPFQKVRTTRSVFGRHSKDNCSEKPPKLYQSQLPISHQKKKDLLALCADGTIPVEYHHFYSSLPSVQVSKECLPEPDADEEE